MAGYDGVRMSNNAVKAYANGEKPMSQWLKSDIIETIKCFVNEKKVSLSCDIQNLKKLSAKTLKRELLRHSSWHHTSYYYNETDFYSLDIDKLKKITDMDIELLLIKQKEEAEQEKIKKQEMKEEKWECAYLNWSGSIKHPKAERVVTVGIVKGNWFYLCTGNKKNIHSKGFEFIRKIE